MAKLKHCKRCMENTLWGLIGKIILNTGQVLYLM